MEVRVPEVQFKILYRPPRGPEGPGPPDAAQSGLRRHRFNGGRRFEWTETGIVHRPWTEIGFVHRFRAGTGPLPAPPRDARATPPAEDQLTGSPAFRGAAGGFPDLYTIPIFGRHLCTIPDFVHGPWLRGARRFCPRTMAARSPQTHVLAANPRNTKGPHPKVRP